MKHDVALKIASLPRKLHGNPEGSYRWKSVRKSLASDSDIIASDVRMLYDRKLARSTRALATLDKINSIRFLRDEIVVLCKKKRSARLFLAETPAYKIKMERL